MLEKIKELAYEIESDIINTRRQIHRNPELALNEFQTSKLVTNHLNKLGFEVTGNVGKTGVVALLRGKVPGRTVALRADMDALPIQEQNCHEFKSIKDNIMHACGHDAHTAILLGAATILSKIQDSIKGNIKFIFQPSEETGLGGARSMIEEGVLENPKVDAIFGLHVNPELQAKTIGYREGAICATGAGFKIDIIGKGGHGSSPHDAIDSIIIASEVVRSLQTISSSKVDPRETFVLTVGTINGGYAANVIADKVTLTGTIRYFNNGIIVKVKNDIENIVDHITAAHGATYKFNFHAGGSPVINDNKMVNIVKNAAVEILNEKDVILVPQCLWGEDFALYASLVPAAFVLLGVGYENRENYPLHNSRFDINEEALPVGAALLAYSAMSFLTNDLDS